MHLLEIWSAAVGRLQPARVPWRWQGAGFVPSMDTTDKHVCRRYGFLLLDVGSAYPWALRVGGAMGSGGVRISCAVPGRTLRVSAGSRGMQTSQRRLHQ